MIFVLASSTIFFDFIATANPISTKLLPVFADAFADLISCLMIGINFLAFVKFFFDFSISSLKPCEIRNENHHKMLRINVKLSNFGRDSL